VRLSRKEPRQLRSSPRATAAVAIFGENLAHANFAGPGVPAPESSRRDDTSNSRAVRIDLTPAAWRGGFKEARRHSVRVWALRRTAIAGSVLAIAFIFAAVLVDPLRHLPVDFSVKRVGLEGTKVTVEFPRVSGLQKNGRPFEIKARSGVQDVAVSNIIELQDIESALGTAESSTTWVSAAHGIYDSLHDKLTLDGDVHIKSSTGYDIWLRTARIDFKSGGLVSEEPVRVALDGGAIEAKELDVSDNGHKVSFGGDVTSMIENREEEPGAIEEIAENGQ
jgi:lipopolysaccharide export system protein LptC